MKWKIDTKKINGEHRVIGYHHSTNRGETVGLLESATCPQLDMTDVNGKPQLVSDLQGNITTKPIPLTADETEVKRKQYVIKQIRSKYTVDQELALLRRQLTGEENSGWDEYTTYVEQVIIESQEGA